MHYNYKIVGVYLKGFSGKIMWHTGTKSDEKLSAMVHLPSNDVASVSLFFPVPRGWTRSFAFPIAQFVLSFFVSHLTVCSSFAAFNFLRSSLRSLLTFSFSLSLFLSLSSLFSSSSWDRAEESLKGGVNEAARLSHGRSRRRGKQVRLAPVAGANLPIYSSYVGSRHRKLPLYRCVRTISYR